MCQVGSRILMRVLSYEMTLFMLDLPPETPLDKQESRSEDERRARSIVEKKTVINLIEAFAIAVKHYLRNEEGIKYVDLYHLVKFLPSYAFPAGVIRSPTKEESRQVYNVVRRSSYVRQNGEEEKRSPQVDNESEGEASFVEDDRRLLGDERPLQTSPMAGAFGTRINNNVTTDVKASGLATDTLGHKQRVSYDFSQPATSKNDTRSRARRTRARPPELVLNGHGLEQTSENAMNFSYRSSLNVPTTVSSGERVSDGVSLRPASMPPKYSVLNLFPFSIFFTRLLRKSGETDADGKILKTGRERRHIKNDVVTLNVPLEITTYLVSAIDRIYHKSLD
jgi:ion channel-forming bestrophin family protein